MTHIIVYKAIDDDGNSYWPEMFPIETLQSWQKLRPVSFSSQYLSSPMDLSGNELKREWLNYYDWNNRPLEFEKVVAFIDPAVSQQTTADYFAVCVAGLLDKTAYLLDLIRTRTPLEGQKDIIKGLVKRWSVNEVCVEVNAQQLYLLQYLKQFSFDIFSLDEEFAPFTSPDREWSRSNKETKFSTLAGHFNTKRVLLPANLDDNGFYEVVSKFQVFIEEWITFPDGLHDDTLDAVAGVTSRLVSATMALSSWVPDTVQLREFVEKSIPEERMTEEMKEALEEYEERGAYEEITRYGFNLRNIKIGS